LVESISRAGNCYDNAAMESFWGTLKRRGSKQKVALLPRPKIRKMFFVDCFGTKEAIAATLAEQFPDELRPLLPPRRQSWMSEDHHMLVFDAVAAAIALQRLEMN
jgi:transposase InsO family protein